MASHHRKAGTPLWNCQSPWGNVFRSEIFLSAAPISFIPKVALFSTKPESTVPLTTASQNDLHELETFDDTSWLAQRAVTTDELARPETFLPTLLLFNAMIPLSSSTPHSFYQPQSTDLLKSTLK